MELPAMIAVKCPTCSASLAVKDEYAGKVGKCKKCGDSIKVPDAPKPARTPTPPPVSQPVAVQPQPQIIYIEKPSSPSYNVPRLILVIASSIGAIGTFLPWVSSPIMSINGSAGDGWITFVLHIAIICFAMPGTPYHKVYEVSKFFIFFIAVALILFTAWKGLMISNYISRDDNVLIRSMVQVGIGLYLAGFSAVAGLLALFIGNRE